MKNLSIFLFLISSVYAQSFSEIREANIKILNSSIKVYKDRIECIENGNNAKKCIEKHPSPQFENMPNRDSLGKLMINMFPTTYYLNILKRDIKVMEKEKLCWGKSMNFDEVKECLVD
ncbi:hypothetical protein [Nitrosophilus alvini]|uniref:hypothetical protein n=1 Tax=Nitrosophilus alvini TaxID=2714855 RepID=UPI00190E364B|nr:hypothetical protein [Nitrosophilus alvini]